jgi:hypothetical protein
LNFFVVRPGLVALTAEGWHEWSAALCARLSDLTTASPGIVATVIAQSLVARSSRNFVDAFPAVLGRSH